MICSLWGAGKFLPIVLFPAFEASLSRRRQTRPPFNAGSIMVHVFRKSIQKKQMPVREFKHILEQLNYTSTCLAYFIGLKDNFVGRQHESKKVNNVIDEKNRQVCQSKSKQFSRESFYVKHEA
jgi:hypothetical protein